LIGSAPVAGTLATNRFGHIICSNRSMNHANPFVLPAGRGKLL
jgi:hypothetical protein